MALIDQIREAAPASAEQIITCLRSGHRHAALELLRMDAENDPSVINRLAEAARAVAA